MFQKVYAHFTALKMTKKCCISNCRLQKDDPGCSNLNFFKIPKDEKIRTEWAKSVNNFFNTEIEFKKCSFVCARHFESTCFNYGPLCKTIRIKKGSYPTKFEKLEQNEVIQKSPTPLINDSDDEMDPSSKECTTTSASLVNASKTRLLDSFNTIIDNNYMDQQQDEKESNLSEKSFSDSENVIQEAVEKNLYRKSLANINLNSIDLNNTKIVRRLLEKTQREIRTLRRSRRIQLMKFHRINKIIKNTDSLISHLKNRNLISENVSKILKVIIEGCECL